MLFQVKEDSKGNPFFDWQKEKDEKTIDLGLLLTPDIALNSFITGYIGTDTMPPCTKSQCWYVIETPFEISQEQLDYFKTMDPKIPHNARMHNLGTYPKQTQLLNAPGLNVPAS